MFNILSQINKIYHLYIKEVYNNGKSGYSIIYNDKLFVQSVVLFIIFIYVCIVI